MILGHFCVFSKYILLFVCLQWAFIRAIINVHFSVAFLMKDSDNDIMKQVF